MSTTIEKKLNKLSKEALIKAIIKNSEEESILINARHYEFEILQNKQEIISKEMLSVDPFLNFEEWEELDGKYRRYEKQINNLLGISLK